MENMTITITEKGKITKTVECETLEISESANLLKIRAKIAPPIKQAEPEGRFEMYEAIIERVEATRIKLGMNKTQFTAKMGLKPQTYNNFISSQGTKPSVDLIYGVIHSFGVDANYLLTGKTG